VPPQSPESHEPEFNTVTHNESNVRFRNGAHVTSSNGRVNRNCLLGNDINPNDNSQGKHANSLFRCENSPDFENHNQERDDLNSVVFQRKIANVSSCF
jgi:hypothetical protein